jgi:hypothetical protein
MVDAAVADSRPRHLGNNSTRGRTMLHKIVARAAATAVLGVGVVMGGALPADAATASVHRGSDGCFNYSYGDGIETTTVYFHNTCGHSANLWINWHNGSLRFATCQAVGGGAKGHIKRRGVPSDIKQVATCS